MVKVCKERKNFEKLEKAFQNLRKDISDTSSLQLISETLNCILPGMEFKTKIIIPNKKGDELFIMSVYPSDQSKLNLCIDAIISGKTENYIKELWKKQTKWNIEIDSRIFDLELSDDEMIAILFHEIGHIVRSNYLPRIISNIIRFEILNKPLINKILIKSNDVAKKIMSLPILNACHGYNRMTPSLKEEIGADKFAIQLGYKKELESAISKLINIPEYKNSSKDNASLIKISHLTDEALDELRARKGHISSTVSLLRKESVENSETLNEFFESLDYSNIETYMVEGINHEYSNSFDSMFDVSNVMLEFFGMKKELKKIDSMIIDYILVSINKMKTENDRMMILSYIHSKLDIINYYLELLKDKKSNKYKIPNTESELKIYRTELYELRKMAIERKLPEKNNNILIQWADGYEG